MAQHFITGSNFSPLILVVTWFTCSISVLSLVGRGATQIILARSIRPDDYTIVLSVVSIEIVPTGICWFGLLTYTAFKRRSIGRNYHRIFKRAWETCKSSLILTEKRMPEGTELRHRFTMKHIKLIQSQGRICRQCLLSKQHMLIRGLGSLICAEYYPREKGSTKASQSRCFYCPLGIHEHCCLPCRMWTTYAMELSLRSLH